MVRYREETKKQSTCRASSFQLKHTLKTHRQSRPKPHVAPPTNRVMQLFGSSTALAIPALQMYNLGLRVAFVVLVLLLVLWWADGGFNAGPAATHAPGVHVGK